jgi:hypothetical protein
MLVYLQRGSALWMNEYIHLALTEKENKFWISDVPFVRWNIVHALYYILFRLSVKEIRERKENEREREKKI